MKVHVAALVVKLALRAAIRQLLKCWAVAGLGWLLLDWGGVHAAWKSGLRISTWNMHVVMACRWTRSWTRSTSTWMTGTAGRSNVLSR